MAQWDLAIDLADLEINTTHKYMWIQGPTTAVSLKVIEHFFLCGTSLMMVLPRQGEGTCTIVNVVPNVKILNKEELASGQVPNLGSFLLITLHPCERRETQFQSPCY